MARYPDGVAACTYVNLGLPAVIDDEAMADAAASRQGPLVLAGIHVLRILMAKVANCSDRELANRIHAEPIRQVLRGQSTEHARVGRGLVSQWQQRKLEVENLAIGVATASAGNSSDKFSCHRPDKVVDRASALLVPKADKGRASQLPAERCAQPRAGDAE